MHEIHTSLTEEEKLEILENSEISRLSSEDKKFYDTFLMFIGLDLVREERQYIHARKTYTGLVREITELEVRYAEDLKFSQIVRLVEKLYEDLQLIKLMLFIAK